MLGVIRPFRKELDDYLKIGRSINLEGIVDKNDYIIKVTDNIKIYNLNVTIPCKELSFDNIGSFAIVSEVNNMIFDNWNIMISYEYDDPFPEMNKAHYSGVEIKISYTSIDTKQDNENLYRENFRIPEPYPLSLFINPLITPDHCLSMHFFSNGNFECGSYFTNIKG